MLLINAPIEWVDDSIEADNLQELEKIVAFIEPLLSSATTDSNDIDEAKKRQEDHALLQDLYNKAEIAFKEIQSNAERKRQSIVLRNKKSETGRSSTTSILILLLH